ncbi:legume-like lectin family protein [Xylaria bambusicola]|uniref:legume-like lectin family protein n=1 Tax=Xylaria bambusicola TaxID=326684 RepID=UPI0020074AB1|nr:legume-like lectin family protein [Xylaria bambusicola]KAI0512781.1 legume-like lectin family protein [Xylaria bambusicola]
MRLIRPDSILALGLATLATARAQFLVSELSFGYTGKINDRGEAKVPGFTIQGTPNVPEILSNKLILTPPVPGNARGAVWADKTNQYSEWVADVDFRANGGERGSGNLNIWLARQGSQEIGSSSIYTVGRFDGLALVIDQHGGSAGMIRGFLNDGSIDFKSHHSVDSLAFGHCYYAYRNLGRPSQIKIRQTAQSFKVEIDNRLCFDSDQITIPPGYQYGISAASADNPDSFEIFKLVVMTQDLAAKSNGAPPTQQKQQNDGQNQAKAQTSYGRNNRDTNNAKSDETFDESIPDASADTITSSKAQFADLHNRLQSVNHHLSTIFRQNAGMNNMNEKRHEETSRMIDDLKSSLSKIDKLDKLDRLEWLVGEVTKMQRDIQSIKTDMNNRISQSENNLKRAISSNHGTMLEHVAVQATPRHGKLIFVIIGSQIILVAGYIYYERKKTLPKKYL